MMQTDGTLDTPDIDPGRYGPECTDSAIYEPKHHTISLPLPTVPQTASLPLPTVLQKLSKWGNYKAFGAPLADTKFIPMKTPLSKNILDHWSLPEAPRYRLTVPDLISAQEALGRRVGMILDLSNHDCLYSGDIPSSVTYVHLHFVAKELPPLSFVRQVYQAAQTYWKHNDDYIAVHCAYGFNRTGFVLASYLVEVCEMSVQAALDAFGAARPPGVKHEDFRQELFARYGTGTVRGLHTLPSSISHNCLAVSEESDNSFVEGSAVQQSGSGTASSSAMESGGVRAGSRGRQRGEEHANGTGGALQPSGSKPPIVRGSSAHGGVQGEGATPGVSGHHRKGKGEVCVQHFCVQQAQVVSNLVSVGLSYPERTTAEGAEGQQGSLPAGELTSAPCTPLERIRLRGMSGEQGRPSFALDRVTSETNSLGKHDNDSLGLDERKIFQGMRAHQLATEQVTIPFQLNGVLSTVESETATAGGSPVQRLPGSSGGGLAGGSPLGGSPVLRLGRTSVQDIYWPTETDQEDGAGEEPCLASPSQPQLPKSQQPDSPTLYDPFAVQVSQDLLDALKLNPV